MESRGDGQPGAADTEIISGPVDVGPGARRKVKRLLAYAWLVSFGASLLALLVYLAVRSVEARTAELFFLGILGIIVMSVWALDTLLEGKE